jgi:hypothetical protein
MQVIKFKNYGLDLIEVEDNGSGISSDDYDQIGTAPHTLHILIQDLNIILPSYLHSRTWKTWKRLDSVERR